MKEELWKLLEELGYEVYEQGSIPDNEEYPNNFFTLWNDETIANYYDNKEQYTVWEFTIDAYSINPNTTFKMLMEAKEKLIYHKWIVPGKGKDIASDSKKHSGRTINARYIEKGGQQNV